MKLVPTEFPSRKFNKPWSGEPSAEKLAYRSHFLADSGVRTPRGWVLPGGKGICFEFASGTGGRELFSTPKKSDEAQVYALDRVLSTLHQLHRINTEALNLPTVDPWRLIRSRMEKRAVAIPEAWDLAALVSELEKNRPVSKIRGLCHGDFHCGQLIFPGGSSYPWVLDLDRLSIGPREHDLGNFVGHWLTHGYESSQDLDVAWGVVWDHVASSSRFGASFAYEYKSVVWHTALCILRRALKGLESNAPRKTLDSMIRFVRTLSNRPSLDGDVSWISIHTNTHRSKVQTSFNLQSLARVDLDSKGRWSALGKKEKGEQTFWGVSEEKDSWNSYSMLEDPKLFSKPIWKMILDWVGSWSVFNPTSYRPLKRAVFYIETRKHGPAYLKVKRRPLSESTLALISNAWWPDLFASTEIKHGNQKVTCELWGPLLGSSLSEEIRLSPMPTWEPHVSKVAREVSLWSVLAEKLLPASTAYTPGNIFRQTQRAVWRCERIGLLSRSVLFDPWLQTAAGIEFLLSRNSLPAWSHGDFHEGQIFMDRGMIQWLDPDMVQPAPAEWDVANLAAHLDVTASDQSGKDTLCDGAVIEGLKKGVQDARGSFDEPAFDLLRASALLRLAAVYGMRPGNLAKSERIASMGWCLIKTILVLAMAFVWLGQNSSKTEASPIDQIRSGVWVEAEGDWESDLKIDVDEIELKPLREGRRPKLQGVLQSFDVATRAIVVLNRPFLLAPQCRIETAEGDALGLESLNQAQVVRIVLASSGYNASVAEVRLLNAPVKDEAEVEGFATKVERKDGRLKFEVNNIKVRVDDDAEVIIVEGFKAPLPPIATSNSREQRTDPDWQPPGVPLNSSGNMLIGGRFNLSYKSDDNQLLNSDSGTSNSRRLHMRNNLTWIPSPWAHGKVELRFDRETVSSSILTADQSESQIELGPTYFFVRPKFFPNSAVQVGRIDLDEDREWLYDHTLDGARIFLVSWRAQAQLGIFLRSLNPAITERDEKFIVANAAANLAEGFVPEMHLVNRVDRRSTDDRSWLAVRLPLKLNGQKFWVDAVRGSGQYRERDLRAWAFDLGLRLRIKKPFRLYGYGILARGSGDPNRDDGVDREFRDTGLSDNSDSFGGVKSFDYYGVALEPELSNLRVIKVGMGFRPVYWASLDVTQTYFRQDYPRDRFRSNLDDLGLRPNGLSPDLGSELDFIFGLRDAAIPFGAKLTMARFSPGSAFENRKVLSEVRFEVEKKW